MPEQDVVVAIQANAYNMQAEINLIWDYLLPAIHDQALPEDKVAEAALKQKTASLAIVPPKGIHSDLQKSMNKEITYTFTDNDQNDRFSIRFTGDTCILHWLKESLFFGREQWLAGETHKPVPNLIANMESFREFPPFKTYGSFCWTDEKNLSLRLIYIESPHTELLELTFSGDSIYTKQSNSMNYNRQTTRTGVK
jgi:hypothetical protein